MASAMHANGHGIALDPILEVLFERVGLGSDRRVDARDLSALRSNIAETSSDVVVYLATQPPVCGSCLHPVDTSSTNALGTVNSIMAAMVMPSIEAVPVDTTDKVCRNVEQASVYGEDDFIRGDDLRNRRRAYAEPAAHTLALSRTESEAWITAVRPGNVLGRGDIAKVQLILDLIRSFSRDEPAVVRCPDAVRSRQHVMGSLHGNTRVAGRQPSGQIVPSRNLGCDPEDGPTVPPVADAVALSCRGNGDGPVDADADHLHGAGPLLLDSARAHSEMGWRPLFSSRYFVNSVVAWHRDVDDGSPTCAAMRSDLDGSEDMMGSEQ